MTHKLGMHWLPYHMQGWEFNHIARMGYRSIRLFEQNWNNADFCNRLLLAAPADCLFVLRDWPLSEQKSDIWVDPEATGKRHAREWNEKFTNGVIQLPPDRCVVLGANELDTINGDRDAIDVYFYNFLRDLTSYGRRGAGLSFGVGHPRTVDGTTQTERDWSPFERTHSAAVRGHHFIELHEYGSAANPGWGYWLCGFWTCPWPDVQIMIGECGIDENVADGKGNRGWLVSMPDIAQYTYYINVYHGWLMSDPRIHSAQVFTFDFSHPWASFNVAIESLASKWETYDWAQGTVSPVEPVSPTDEWKAMVETKLSEMIADIMVIRDIIRDA